MNTLQFYFTNTDSITYSVNGSKYFHADNTVSSSDLFSKSPLTVNSKSHSFTDFRTWFIDLTSSEDNIIENIILEDSDYLCFRFKEFAYVKQSSVLYKSEMVLSSSSRDSDYLPAGVRYRLLLLKVRKSFIEKQLSIASSIYHIYCYSVEMSSRSVNCISSTSLVPLSSLDLGSTSSLDLFYERCCSLLAEGVKNVNSHVASYKPPLTSDFISLANSVRLVLMQDLSRKIANKSLALELNSNRTTLLKAFSSVYDETILKFQTRERMIWAAYCLASGDYSINDVIEGLGYKHKGHFAARFKSVLGFSPKDVRYITN